MAGSQKMSPEEFVGFILDKYYEMTAEADEQEVDWIVAHFSSMSAEFLKIIQNQQNEISRLRTKIKQYEIINGYGENLDSSTRLAKDLTKQKEAYMELFSENKKLKRQLKEGCGKHEL